MKSKTFLLFALLCGVPGLALADDGPIAAITVRPTTTATTITLGDAPPLFAQPSLIFPVALPTAPLTVQRGTHLQIVMPVDGVTNPVVTWYKDGKPLSYTGAVLDIPTVSVADSGGYSANVRDAAGTTTKGSDTANVLVTDKGAALINLSTRARLNAAQPTLLTGFVVQPGPAKALLLVRAIGPALAQFGVTDPLAAPQLTILDSKGHEVARWDSGSVIFIMPPGTSTSTPAQVGAFPLPPGSKDIERTYWLPPGSYTAQVSSADGGSGTVLLEVYQFPL